VQEGAARRKRANRRNWMRGKGDARRILKGEGGEEGYGEGEFRGGFE
jgi:hypothetical protein